MSDEQKDSFVFYRSFYNAIKKLKKKDQLTIYSYICEYVFDQKTGSLEGVPAAIFDLIKPQIDANLRRYENGKKGGKPKTKSKPRPNLDLTKTEPNVNVNVNDNVNVNVNENVNAVGYETTRQSLPPSEKICQAYIDMKATIRGITPDFNANKFISYYNARDWMSGNTKIADWKAAVDIWLNRSEEKICADDDEDPFADLKGSF